MEQKSSENIWLIDTSYNFIDSISFDYLLRHLKIVAITCVGTTNNPTSLIKQKVSKHISSIDKSLKIEVFEGSNIPFINYEKELNDDKIENPYELKSCVESNGEVKPNEIINLENVAAIKIIELAKKFGKKLNILTLGPLTNLAIAVLIDSSITDKINSLVVTGGSLKNWGNSGNSAEYNFRFDPVAAKNIFKYCSNKIVIPLEIDREFGAKLFNSTIMKKLKNKDNADKFELVINYLIELGKESEYSLVNFNTLSLFSSLYAINPKVLSDCVSYPSDIDIIGRLTRGILVMEKYPHIQTGKLVQTNFATSFNEEILIDLILS